MSSGSFKILSTNSAFTNHMYKEDFALNNLQWLIYHKTKSNDITRTGSLAVCYTSAWDAVSVFLSAPTEHRDKWSVISNKTGLKVWFKYILCK